MSRTYRNEPAYFFRAPKTCNELRQVRVSDTYYDDEYSVHIRHRYIPTLWDDVRHSARKELDHHH